MRISIPSTYPLGPSFQDNGADRNAKKTRCETSGDSLRKLDTSRALDASYGGVPADKENLPAPLSTCPTSSPCPASSMLTTALLGRNVCRWHTRRICPARCYPHDAEHHRHRGYRSGVRCIESVKQSHERGLVSRRRQGGLSVERLWNTRER